MTGKSFFERTGYCLLLVVLLTCIGCNSKAKQYSFSGNVTYNGTPVPYGSVVFTPDSSRGTVGTQVVAAIEDGRYSLTAVNGLVAGYYSVEVSGLHNMREGDSGPVADTLFENQRESVEVQPDALTRDFNIEGTAIEVKK
ncbi:MAG: hypothetical protein Q4G68_00550 [Planctomycetia bacterium]|nr:hypothetical protein [Planctomycetia bacterium]